MPNEMPKPVVLVENLYRFYGARCAVNNLSFTLYKGEVLGLLGPNGAGKTTTIGILTTRVRPTAGRAAIGGADVVAHHLEASTVRPHQPAQRGDERRLSRAIGTEQREELALVDLERHAGERVHRAEALVHVADLDRGH